MITVSANNGTAPGSALSVLPGYNGNGTPHTAPHNTAASYDRIRSAMVAAGLGDPIPTDGWSCYRDRAAQQHMLDIGATTIPVGQSIHGEWTYGSAVDFANLGGFGAPRHNWLRDHGGQYGWYQPGWAQAGGSLPEPWHWEYDERNDQHIGEDDVTPDEVYAQCSEAIKAVLRAPEFQGYARDLPWGHQATAVVGEAPVTTSMDQFILDTYVRGGWRTNDTVNGINATTTATAAAVDELAASGVRSWPSTTALILSVAIIAGLTAGLINKAVEAGVWAGAATLLGGLIGWAASTLSGRIRAARTPA